MKRLPCVILVGMPGAGKTTIGARLAKDLDWAFMDSDHVIESLYSTNLQSVTDALGKEAFLDVECEVICSMRLSRCVIATGGSVVYRQKAMDHLATLGPIVYIELALEKIEARVAANPLRGIAMAPGQSLADLYAEREMLYRNASALVCNSGEMNPQECSVWLRKKMKELRILNL